MKCNSCWAKILPLHKESYYITQCSHLFCCACASKIFNSSLVCPNCQTSLDEDGIAVTDMMPSAEKIKLLCGLEPPFILQAASRAIEFWSFQMELSNQEERKENENWKIKLSEIEKAHQNKIHELQINIKTLNSHLDSIKMERDLQKREILELQEQYTERVRQKKQLEELYNNLKKSLEESIVSKSPKSFLPNKLSNIPRNLDNYKSSITSESPKHDTPRKSDLFKALSPLNKNKSQTLGSRNLFNSSWRGGNSEGRKSIDGIITSTPYTSKNKLTKSEKTKDTPIARLRFASTTLERPSTPLLTRLSSMNNTL